MRSIYTTYLKIGTVFCFMCTMFPEQEKKNSTNCAVRIFQKKIVIQVDMRAGVKSRNEETKFFSST